jgi:hypothetical protein
MLATLNTIKSLDKILRENELLLPAWWKFDFIGYEMWQNKILFLPKLEIFRENPWFLWNV